MTRVILTVLAFATATALSTTPVLAINTHTYNGSYCKASYGSQSADFRFDLNSIVNVSSGTRMITCPILMDEAVYQTGIGANIYVYFVAANANDYVICTVYSLHSDGVVLQSRAGSRTGSGWVPDPGNIVPQPAIIISADDATYNMACQLPRGGRITAVQVDEND